MGNGASAKQGIGHRALPITNYQFSIVPHLSDKGYNFFKLIIPPVLFLNFQGCVFPDFYMVIDFCEKFD